MRTEFKVFKGGYDSLGEYIEEYQRMHNARIKNVVLIEHNDVKTVIGVVFEKSSEYEELEDLKYGSWRCY